LKKAVLMQEATAQKTILIVGASRGLGFAMVEEYLRRGWRVIATGRTGSNQGRSAAGQGADVTPDSLSTERNILGFRASLLKTAPAKAVAQSFRAANAFFRT